MKSVWNFRSEPLARGIATYLSREKLKYLITLKDGIPETSLDFEKLCRNSLEKSTGFPLSSRIAKIYSGWIKTWLVTIPEKDLDFLQGASTNSLEDLKKFVASVDARGQGHWNSWNVGGLRNYRLGQIGRAQVMRGDLETVRWILKETGNKSSVLRHLVHGAVLGQEETILKELVPFYLVKSHQKHYYVALGEHIRPWKGKETWKFIREALSRSSSLLDEDERIYSLIDLAGQGKSVKVFEDLLTEHWDTFRGRNISIGHLPYSEEVLEFLVNFVDDNLPFDPAKQLWVHLESSKNLRDPQDILEIIKIFEKESNEEKKKNIFSDFLFVLLTRREYKKVFKKFLEIYGEDLDYLAFFKRTGDEYLLDQPLFDKLFDHILTKIPAPVLLRKISQYNSDSSGRYWDTLQKVYDRDPQACRESFRPVMTRTDFDRWEGREGTLKIMINPEGHSEHRLVYVAFVIEKCLDPEDYKYAQKETIPKPFVLRKNIEKLSKRS